MSEKNNKKRDKAVICDGCGSTIDNGKVYIKSITKDRFVKGHKVCMVDYKDKKKEQ